MKVIPVTKITFNDREQEMLRQWLTIHAPHHVGILIIQADYEMYDHCISIPATNNNTYYFRLEDIMHFVIHGEHDV